MRQEDAGQCRGELACQKMTPLVLHDADNDRLPNFEPALAHSTSAAHQIQAAPELLPWRLFLLVA